MAVKFKFTPERLASVCTVPEYIGALNGSLYAITRILPKMVVDDSGKYLVTVTHDEDGDIENVEGMEQAQELLNNLTPERLTRLTKDLVKAFREVVNPTSGSS